MIGLRNYWANSRMWNDRNCSSTIDYPSDYADSLDGSDPATLITQQVEALCSFFPDLSNTNPDETWIVREGIVWYQELAVPDWVESPLVYPDWRQLYGNYWEALKQTFRLMAYRGLLSYGQIVWDSEYVQMMEETVRAEHVFINFQEGPFLLVPSQSGVKNRGQAAIWFDANLDAHEFGLNTFAEACRLISFPKRIRPGKNLSIECGGDRYNVMPHYSETHFNDVPIFTYAKESRRSLITTKNACWGNALCGTSSGFVPP